MEFSFVEYSKAVLSERAIPNLEDGKKPSALSVLYAMYDLGVFPNDKTVKSARVVGEVLGKYHPHSDCFFASTLMYGLDGKDHKIVDLYEKGIKELDVLAFDEVNDKFVPAKAHSFRIGQYTNKIYHIHLYGGGCVKCTSNHPFYLSVYNKWIKAEDIKELDILNGASLRDAQYVEIKDRNGFQGRLHQYLHPIIPNGYERHHINMNKYDNRPENLSILTIQDHRRAHKDISVRGLIKGRKTMSRKEYKEAHMARNRILAKQLNENNAFIKACSHLRKVINMGYSGTEENYTLNKNITYSCPKLSTIYKKGYTFNDILDGAINGIKLDTSKVIGIGPDVYKKPHIDRRNRIRYISARLASATLNVLRYAAIRGVSITEDNYTKIRNEYNLLIGKGRGGIPYRCSYSLKKILKFGKFDEFIKELYSYSPELIVEKVVIEEVDNVPMYDFTVDKYHNCLIHSGIKGVEARAYLVAHNSSSYGTLVNMTQDFNCNIPYIVPNGNFGSVSGDTAAAMRYCHVDSTVVDIEGIGEISVKDFIKKYNLDENLNDGYMFLKDLNIKIKDKDNKYVPTDCLIYSGEHPTIEMKVGDMNDNEFETKIEGTFNHPVFVLDKFNINGNTWDSNGRIDGNVLGKWITLGEIFNHDFENEFPIYPFLVDKEGNTRLGYIKAMTKFAFKSKVYSFRVQTEDHSYITNGLISHNTECKLSWYSKEVLMRDLNKNVVPYQLNFDDSLEYATYLPAMLPDILINGSYGIAVGFNTSFLPHNLNDVINLCIAYLNNRTMTPEEMYSVIQGPDFPLPCIINGTDGLQRIYTSGNGYCRIRGTYEVETDKKGNTRFVITSVPYRTLTTGICTEIGKLYESGEIDIKDLRDESSKSTGIRICLDLGKSETVDRVLSLLVSRTSFEKSVSANHNLLIDGKFRQNVNIKVIIEEFIKFREKCLNNKFMTELKQRQDRLHILEGLFIVNQDIDRAIKIIKTSDNTADARTKLMKTFKLSEAQANYILDLKLARLTKLNMSDAREEEKNIKERVKVLLKLTRSVSNKDVDKYMISEWEEIRSMKEAKPYLVRRAKIQKRFDKVTIDDTIPDDPCSILFTKKGYLKRTDSLAKEQKRGGKGSSVGTLQEGDEIKQILHTTMRQELIFLTSQGRVYKMKAHEIEHVSRVARGALAKNLLGLKERENIVLCFINESSEGVLVSCSKKGMVKSTTLKALEKINSSGKNMIGVGTGDSIVDVVVIPSKDKHKDILIASSDGMCIRIDSEDIRPTGTGAFGVIGMKLRDDDFVVSMTRVIPNIPVVFVTQKGFIKRVNSGEFAVQNKNGIGVRCTDTKNGARIVAMVSREEDESIFIYTKQGKSLTCDLSTIRKVGRTAVGVKGITLAPGDSVIGIS